MKFVPLPQFMVSYDVVPVFGATIKWSSPASPLAVSKPLPGSKRSSPTPPFSVSLAPRPESLSEPARPLSVSFCLVPGRLSLPDVPLRFTASTLDAHTKREARTKATSITGNILFFSILFPLSVCSATLPSLVLPSRPNHWECSLHLGRSSAPPHRSGSRWGRRKAGASCRRFTLFSSQRDGEIWTCPDSVDTFPLRSILCSQFNLLELSGA